MDENPRAVGMLNEPSARYKHKNEGMFVPGREKGRKTPVTTACPESWKVKVMDKKINTLKNIYIQKYKKSARKRECSQEATNCPGNSSRNVLTCASVCRTYPFWLLGEST